MKKRPMYILLNVFLWSATCLYAQKQGQELIDSLNTELLNVKNDSAKQRIMAKLTWPYTMTGKIDSAIYAAHNSLRLSEKLSYRYGIADAHNDLGNVYNLIGDYPEAIKVFKIAIRTIGNSDAKKDKILLGWAHSNLSEAYLKWRKYDEALENVLIALQYKQETGETYWLGSSYYNLGDIHLNQHEYQKAHESYEFGLKVAQKANNSHHIILGHLGIGDMFSLQGKYVEALESYNFALKTAEATDEKFAISQSYQKIGAAYNKIRNPSKAKKWLTKSILLGKEIRANKTIKESYRNLVTSDSLLGNFEEALKNQKLYETYKDKIFNEINSNKVAYLEMSYVFEKEKDSIQAITEKEIAVRDATLETNRKQRWLYIGGIVGLAVIGGLLYHQNRRRRQINQKLQKLNDELDNANKIKTRFFSILNHDLRSPVSNLIHFLHLKKESPETLDEDTKIRLEQKTIQGAENLLVAMEDLLLWSKSQMENFKPNPQKIRIDRLFDNTKKYFTDIKNVEISFENTEGLILITDENYLKTIARNLTSNAVKALQQTDNARIIWKALRKDEKIVLSITDNGPGADSEKFRALYDDKEVVGIKSGLGMHLIRDLAKAINCTIVVDSAKRNGTSIFLKFDKTK